MLTVPSKIVQRRQAERPSEDQLLMAGATMEQLRIFDKLEGYAEPEMEVSPPTEPQPKKVEEE